MSYLQNNQRQNISLKSIIRRLFFPGQNADRGVSATTRFAEFGRGASGIIHDLANPLTVISLSLEQLQGNTLIKNTEAKKQINSAVKAAKNMKLFLSTAKKQLWQKEPDSFFEISKEIKMTIKFFRSVAKKSKIKIKYRQKQAVFVCGDRVKFFRIISNLISNAMDSYISFPPERNKLVIIKTELGDKTSTISVRDFGCGIPKHLQKVIFEPFYSTKQKKEGAAGLGLSIVKNIIENDFRGRIKVDSTIGRGSVFKVTLPIVQNH